MTAFTLRRIRPSRRPGSPSSGGAILFRGDPERRRHEAEKGVFPICLPLQFYEGIIRRHFPSAMEGFFCVAFQGSSRHPRPAARFYGRNGIFFIGLIQLFLFWRVTRSSSNPDDRLAGAFFTASGCLEMMRRQLLGRIEPMRRPLGPMHVFRPSTLCPSGQAHPASPGKGAISLGMLRQSLTIEAACAAIHAAPFWCRRWK